MKINKLLIFDTAEEVANSFEFGANENIIYSKGNSAGKSCLLKSIYYSIGLPLKQFPSGWNIEKMVFKVFYEHNNKYGYIIRMNNFFWINDCSKPLDMKEYSKWFLDLLNISNMKLPLNRKDELDSVYASVPLSLFYIDQDSSWSGTPYKNTVNLGQYNLNDIPKSIFKYLLGISNDNIVDLNSEKKVLQSQSKKISGQIDTLKELKDNFIQKNNIITTFDKSKIKKEILEYLNLASNMSNKLKKYKVEIYSNKVKLDSLKTELSELDIIIKNLSGQYKSISKINCSQCNSELTTEQSIQRMKLDNNKFEINRYKNSLIKEIEELEHIIEDLINKKVDIDNDYNKFLEIADEKQGELTLNQYIEAKADNIAEDNYCVVQNKLVLQDENLNSDIKGIDSKIRKLQNQTKILEQNIKTDYNDYISSIKLVFPKANFNYDFLKFKVIADSGSKTNQVYLGLYLVYTKILMKYSSIALPFVFDTCIKDDLDDVNYEKFYNLVDKNLLKSNTQTFFVMLDKSTKYIQNFDSYNTIKLASDKRLLNKEDFKRLETEIEIILDK